VKDRPTHATTAGKRYLALRKHAKALGRPTAELLQLFALEGFLARLERSEHRRRLVLKGGVLLAAFDLRRPTRDIDFLALDVDNEPDAVGRLIVEVAAVHIDDGLDFLLETIVTSIIRDDDIYPGVRTRLHVRLATARLRLQVDVNVGDPVVPSARLTEIPPILPGTGPTVLAYPRSMVMAEKLVTALQRGAASTRWRDFADLYLMIAEEPSAPDEVALSIATIAKHRGVRLAPLGDTLAGMPERAQRRWQSWLGQQALLADRLPRSFEAVLRQLDQATRPWLTAAGAADSNSDDDG
jgi:predicted nucleotidyltransferase component of viral defense system